MSETVTSREPGTGRVPLSLQQQFLCLFDEGDASGPFGPRYIIVDGWRVRGRISATILSQALRDVVERHESLRTWLDRSADTPSQHVLAPATPELVEHDLSGVAPPDRDRRAEELVNEVEAGTFSARSRPLLRAVLGRFDQDDHVLVLVTHHTAADAWSMQVIVREVAECYAARESGGTPDLAAPRQYREYTADQAAAGDSAYVRTARAYWRETLRDAGILVVPTDLARTSETEPRTSWYRFVTEPALRSRTLALARETRSSPFMVLLAAFNVLAAERTGVTDVVVPTFTAGRSAGYQQTVGSFFNFVPLRTDIADCDTFRDVVARTRAACLGAYAHELPLMHVLAEAPELMAPAMAPGVAPALFQVIQPPFVMDRERIGRLEYSAIWRRVRSQAVGSDIPDGMLWSVHIGPSDDMVGALGYSAHLFGQSTVDDWVGAYLGLLSEVLNAPEAPLPRR